MPYVSDYRPMKHVSTGLWYKTIAGDFTQDQFDALTAKELEHYEPGFPTKKECKKSISTDIDDYKQCFRRSR